LNIIERLEAATNAHDVDGMVACFADDYELTSPIHPSRSFRGTAQVRRNWEGFFATVPDMVVRIVASATAGEAIWTEWEMTGTRRDGTKHQIVGVFVFGVRENIIRWGRVFLEPVDS